MAALCNFNAGCITHVAAVEFTESCDHNTSKHCCVGLHTAVVRKRQSERMHCPVFADSAKIDEETKE